MKGLAASVVLVAALVMPTAAPAAVTPRARAASLAAALLANFTPPPGSVPADGSPPAALAQPSAVPGGQHLIDVHRIWWVPESPGGVIAFAQAHRPGGLAWAGEGSMSQGATLLADSATDSMPTPPAGLWVAQLTFAAAPMSGGSMLRVDAQVGMDPEMPVLHGPLRR